VHTVVELESFLRAAKRHGISEEERFEIVILLANTPDAGDEISGTGGCRKVRVAGRSKGKSGGYRVITFFTGPRIPVFLITIYPKNVKVTLSASEQRGLKDLAKQLTSIYGSRVVKVGARK
jgi:hypothetical protein